MADNTLSPSAQLSIDATLAHLRRRLEDLTRLVSDWVWETDTELRLKSVSSRVTEFLQVHPQALTGKRLSDIGVFLSPHGEPVTPDLREEFRDAPFAVDGRAGRKLFLVSGVPYFSETTGKFLGVRGVAREAGERQPRPTASPPPAEDRLSPILELSRDAIWEWNVRQGRVFFSASWAERIGLAIEGGHIRAEDWQAAVHPDDRDRTQQALERGIADDDSFELPAYRIHTAAGAWIWVITRAKTVVRDGSGRAIRVAGTHRDVSERQDEEKVLRAAKEEAELASRAKTEFLANMSHELRTPLNSIIGFSDILANETFGPIGRPEYQEYARDINDSGRHLLELISDILDVSRIEANGMQLVESACDLTRLVGSCIRLIRDRALKADIEIVREMPDNLPILFADERRVRQIVLNLLSNALKFTPRGGRVTVAVHQDPPGNLVITISDTGIGIADGDMEMVMTPFRQADGSLTRRYDGAGLGLPLSKSLAELHGGTLSIASKVGQGTTVAVTFPRHRVLSAG